MTKASGLLRSVLCRLSVAFHRPRFYAYAQTHIPCDCPLCLCPCRDKRRYSFVYVSEPRKAVYFAIPKCASTTVRRVVFQGNDHLSLINPKGGLSSYFTFTFIRNPWDRMVSNWKMFTTQPDRIRQLRSMTDEDLSRFADFVRFAATRRNHHWQPQVLYLPEKLDFVGRVENFQTDLEEVCGRIGLPVFRRERRNRTDRLRYWHYYDPPLAALVSEMYSEDVQRFGYRYGDG